MHNFPFCSTPILSSMYPEGFGRIQYLGEAGLGPQWARDLLLPAHRAATHQYSHLLARPDICSSPNPANMTPEPIPVHLETTPPPSVSHRPGARRGTEAHGCFRPHSLHSQEENNHQYRTCKGPDGSLQSGSRARGAEHFLLGWEKSASDGFSGRAIQKHP